MVTIMPEALHNKLPTPGERHNYDGTEDDSMSIDAIINKITEDNGNLVLDLMSRELSGLRGQDTLTILDFTYKPTVGREFGVAVVVVLLNRGMKLMNKNDIIV